MQQSDLEIQVRGNSIQSDIIPGASECCLSGNPVLSTDTCCLHSNAADARAVFSPANCSLGLLSNRPEPVLQMTEAVLDMLVMKGHVGECTAEQHRSLEHAGATANGC